MTKWGAINVVVTNNDPKDFQRLPDFFDAIVVDAPCSGSGLFRKDSDAINEWSSDNVELCSQRQQRILADIIPSLKPGGILIYSTCSYSVQEDEDICDWLLSQDEFESIQIQIQNQWNIVETNSDKFNGFGYRFYPDKLKGEGFFIASFRKKETTISKQIKPKTKLEFIKKSQETAIADWINQSENLIYFTHNNNAIALHKTNIDYLLMLQQSLYLRKAGLNLGTIIRDGLLPSHDLAMSYLINKNVQSIELKKEEALNYLALNETKNNYDSSQNLIVFLDLNMPIMDGWEFLEKFQSQYYVNYPNIKIILLTSSVDPSDKERANQFPTVLEFLSNIGGVGDLQIQTFEIGKLVLKGGFTFQGGVSFTNF
jgi:CheY-like chemotaxis protein